MQSLHSINSVGKSINSTTKHVVAKRQGGTEGEFIHLLKKIQIIVIKLIKLHD